MPSPQHLLLALLAFALAGCPHAQPLPGEAGRRAFASNVVDEMVLPRLAAMVTRSEALAASAAAYGEAGGAAGPAREQARADWREAMSVWQGLEVLHLGPAGAASSFVGGKGLRERIYSWPLTSPCAVDQQLVFNELDQQGWANARLPDVVGLAATEYALFTEGESNACAAAAIINRDGQWQAIALPEIEARRARFAAVVAADLATRVRGLRAAWEDGFAASLRTAGEDGSAFGTAQEAVDQIYAALFFVELGTKDGKLAIPAGLHAECEKDVCPELAESRFAAVSKENIAQNLRTARQVFVGTKQDGTDGAGFDDLLRERGFDETADTMIARLDEAIAHAEALEPTLEDALVHEAERVRALHDAVKGFTDELKGTLPSHLGLRIPEEGAGDND